MQPYPTSPLTSSPAVGRSNRPDDPGLHYQPHEQDNSRDLERHQRRRSAGSLQVQRQHCPGRPYLLHGRQSTYHPKQYRTGDRSWRGQRIPFEVQRGGDSVVITGNLLVNDDSATNAVISLSEVNHRQVDAGASGK